MLCIISIAQNTNSNQYKKIILESDIVQRYMGDQILLNILM